MSQRESLVGSSWLGRSVLCEAVVTRPSCYATLRQTGMGRRGGTQTNKPRRRRPSPGILSRALPLPITASSALPLLPNPSACTEVDQIAVPAAHLAEPAEDEEVSHEDPEDEEEPCPTSLASRWTTTSSVLPP
jgi:hypothetical protein